MKNTKRFLLVLSVVFVLAAAFALATSAATGKVNANDASNDLVWTFDETTKVLTITGTSTELTMDPAPAWNAKGNYPWAAVMGEVTKVVVEAPVTKIYDYAFGYLSNCTTIVLPDNEIEVFGFNIFCGAPKLNTIGPEGTPAGTIDFRKFTGRCNQIAENSMQGQTVTVLMPESGDAPMNKTKVASDTTVMTFKVVAGSPCETFVKELQALTANDFIPDVINIAYYDGTEGTVTPPAEDDKTDDTTTTTPSGEKAPAQTLQEEKTAVAVYGTPTIDGEIDAAWDNATAIDFPYDRQDCSEADLADLMEYADPDKKPWAKMMWDQDYLYVLAVVYDSDLKLDSSIALYNRDGIEIYVDELNEKKPTKSESLSMHQLQIAADGSDYSGDNATMNFTAMVYDDYYVIEVAYKFAKVQPTTDMLIGFDISVNMNNTGNNVRDYCLSWNDRTNITYKAPIYMGNLKLTGEIPVTTVASGKLESQYSNIEWTLDSTGTLRINALAGAAGWNEVPHAENYQDGHWNKYADQIKKVIVGTGLSKIGKEAFLNCLNLESVELGSASQISAAAFKNCPKLTTIYKSGSEPVEGVFDLSNIGVIEGEEAFVNCGMTSVLLTGSITSVGANRFMDCAYLTNVTFGDKVESVDASAFAGCYNLKVLFGTKGGAVETFATANGMTFAEVGADVEIPEAVVTTKAPETTPAPETTTTPEDTTKSDDTTAPGSATQTGDINIVMVVAFAIAALGSAVVLFRKRRFN